MKLSKEAVALFRAFAMDRTACRLCDAAGTSRELRSSYSRTYRRRS